MSAPKTYWRPIRAMRAVLNHGWKFGKDARRRGGISLISPHGTVYEFLAHPPRARLAQNFQLSD